MKLKQFLPQRFIVLLKKHVCERRETYHLQVSLDRIFIDLTGWGEKATCNIYFDNIRYKSVK